MLLFVALNRFLTFDRRENIEESQCFSVLFTARQIMQFCQFRDACYIVFKPKTRMLHLSLERAFTKL